MPRLFFAVILMVTFAIFLTQWSAVPLDWDDSSNIFSNPYYLMHYWWGVWREPYFGLYVPVTSSVWALFYWLGDGETWPFHLLNISLHLVNCVLVYLLLRALARHLRLESCFTPVLAVALFALHPLQVETVAWISGGRDLLATCFGLLATLIYFRWQNKTGYALALGAFTLALLSKPSLVTLPLALLVVERWIYKRGSLVKMLPWFALTLAAIYLTIGAQEEHFVTAVHWWQRPWLMVDNAHFYAHKLLWPAGLSGNYGRTPDLVVSNLNRLFIDGLVVVALFLIVKFVKDPAARVLMLIAAVLMLPVSGIVPFGYEKISGVADHYMYLPMIPLAGLWMILLSARRRLWPVAWLLAVAWACASYSRVQVWHDDQSFFTDMSRTAPDSFSTAIGMSIVSCSQHQNYDEGLRWVDKALAAEPDEIHALANRAYCLLHAGRMQELANMNSYLPRLDVAALSAKQPTAFSSLLASLGTATIDIGQLASGYGYLCAAARILPTDPNNQHNLRAGAEILHQHGVPADCK